MDALFDHRRYLIPFRSTLLPQIFTDTLVIGSGVAGLRAAIEAAQHGQVIVLAKGEPEATNTAWAQGGVAAVVDEGDQPDDHARDTLEAGAGLCDEPIVRRVVGDAPARIAELQDWAMRFDRDGAGRLLLGREGGHGRRRILHALGDATGQVLERCLLDRAGSLDGVRMFSNCFALDLITPTDEPGTTVMGAITHHPRFGLQMIWARATILASGGAGMVYRETSNPPVATGDGLAMAYRAGASLADMAFVQFHPTTLYLPGANRSLITEAIRGEGAHLLDASGHRFMPEVHELAELAPRDTVSLAIVDRIASQGGTHVFLDARSIKSFKERFPGIWALLARFGLDPGRDLIPVHPAAHYMVGGVRTDETGWTGVPGLYAAGEVACTGLHGANRLASNSLLEGLVFGRLAAQAAVGDGRDGGADSNRGARSGTPLSIVSDIRPSEHGELDLADVRSSLRSAMWRNAGIRRTGPRLRDTVDMFNFWARYTLDKIFDEPGGWETQNMLLVGALIARSARWRQETRGCHARQDYPQADPSLAVHDCWRRGWPEPRTEAVAGGSVQAGAAEVSP